MDRLIGKQDIVMTRILMSGEDILQSEGAGLNEMKVLTLIEGLPYWELRKSQEQKYIVKSCLRYFEKFTKDTSPLCERLRCVDFIFELIDEGLLYKIPELFQILAKMAYWWPDCPEGYGSPKNPPELRLRIAKKVAERPTSPVSMHLLGDFLGQDPNPYVSKAIEKPLEVANQKMSSWVQYFSQLGATHVTITVAITFGLFAVLTSLNGVDGLAFILLSFVFALLWFGGFYELLKFAYYLKITNRMLYDLGRWKKVLPPQSHMYEYEEVIAKDKDIGLLRPIFNLFTRLRWRSMSLILPLLAYYFVPWIAFIAISQTTQILLWLTILVIIPLLAILLIWVSSNNLDRT